MRGKRRPVRCRMSTDLSALSNELFLLYTECVLSCVAFRAFNYTLSMTNAVHFRFFYSLISVQVIAGDVIPSRHSLGE